MGVEHNGGAQSVLLSLSGAIPSVGGANFQRKDDAHKHAMEHLILNVRCSIIKVIKANTN